MKTFIISFGTHLVKRKNKGVKKSFSPSQLLDREMIHTTVMRISLAIISLWQGCHLSVGLSTELNEELNLTFIILYILYVVHWCSVSQLYPTLCDPMDCSMPGFPVLHISMWLEENCVYDINITTFSGRLGVCSH